MSRALPAQTLARTVPRIVAICVKTPDAIAWAEYPDVVFSVAIPVADHRYVSGHSPTQTLVRTVPRIVAICVKTPDAVARAEYPDVIFSSHPVAIRLSHAGVTMNEHSVVVKDLSKTLRRFSGGRSRLVRGARGGDLRPPRRERRGQDDDDPDARGAAASERRRRHGRRLGHKHAVREYQEEHRLHVAEIFPLQRPHREGEPPVLRGGLRPEPREDPRVYDIPEYRGCESWIGTCLPVPPPCVHTILPTIRSNGAAGSIMAPGHSVISAAIHSILFSGF